VANLLQITLWVCTALLAYTYVLYPLLMAILARLAPPTSTSLRPDDRLPTVAVIVAAYNEELHVAARIRNILDQDFPEGHLRLYFGSDGSSDNTGDIAASFVSERVIVRPFVQRRGKASVLNDLVEIANEDVLVFTDANTVFEPKAVRRLAERMQDARIGAVCGELDLVDSTGRNPDSTYWKIERMLKRSESYVGGLLGANGGIYAVRREHYLPLPPDTIIDDFVIVMRVAARGAAVVYEPAARAFEETPATIANEFQRRVRIGLGNYQAFFRYPEFLLRTSAATRFTYVSHKVLRWFAPHLMLLVLLTSAALSSPGYRLFFATQVVAYLALATAYTVEHRIRLPALVRLPLFLVSLNFAFLVGFFRWGMGGNGGGAWTPTRAGRATTKHGRSG
jgi:cellulose synthase/poly-beta-1,6-N-acetylglucosamine synthase-like glycosyltransferase